MALVSVRFPNVLKWSLLAGVCVLGFCLRLPGSPRLPEGQFTETDAYLYAHQAQIVSEQGHLPGRDLRRWVPVGRDTRQSLNLYPLVLGYIHKAVAFVFPGVSVSAIVGVAPVVCFSLSLWVFCVFLAGTQGFGVALSVGVILATLPGTIERSASGFGDRDAWCLLLGISAVLSYLGSLRINAHRGRLLWTLLSGFLMFLGGMSWEGFCVFLSVILCVEVWRYLNTDTEVGLGSFALYVFSFVPPLYFTSPAYRSGEGWSTHLFAFLLLPPVAVLALRLLRSWLCLTSPWAARLKTQFRRVSVVLLVLCLSLGVVYLLSIRETFSATTVPFGSGRLMASVGELAAPHFGYWPYRYGSVFFTGSLGVAFYPLCRGGGVARPLTVALGSFCLCVFFRHPMATVCGVSLADGLFATSVLAVLVTFGHLAWKRLENVDARVAGVDPETDPVLRGGMSFFRLAVLLWVAMLAWGVFWLALARGAKRYDFFIGVPLAYFTATLIRDVSVRVCATLEDPKWTTPAFHEKLKKLFVNDVSVAAVLLGGVLLWGPIGGGHVFRSHAAAAHLRHAVPGAGPLSDAYAWMKADLPEGAVVAAEWSYGTQLNVLGGVRTILGPDHYLPYWIEGYHQHVERAKNEQEVIAFLFSHDVTHLMMTTEKQPEGTLLRSGTLSGVFVPRYPEADFQTAPVRVGELSYPAGIEKRPEYLLTAPEEDAHDRQPHHRH